MKIITFMKKNNYNILLPVMALVSFATWFFKFDFVVNIYIYVGLLLLLTVLRQSVSSLMLVSLFSVFGTYSNELHLLYQLLFIYVVIYFIIKNVKRFNKVKGNLFWPLIAITLISLISIFWSPTKPDALAEFLVLIQGVVTYFIIVNDEESRSLSPKNLAWFASFMLLVLGSQYLILTYEFFPNPPDKSHLFNFWLNPNLVAAALGLLWIPSLYKYESFKDNKFVLLYLPLELLTIYAIYMSMSRGLYFGYAISAIIIVLILLKIKTKHIIRLFFSMIIAIITFLVAVILLKDIYPELFAKIEDFSTARLLLYELALTRIKNPLTFLFGDGVGSAQFYLRQAGFGSFYYHSWFFQIFATRGVFSILLQLGLMYKIFRMLNNNERYSKYIMLGFVVYISHSLIDIGYEYQFLGIIYYLIVGTVEQNNKESMYQINLI